MSIICPTITAKDQHSYREQLERVEKFATRIHLDFADDEFTDVKLMNISDAWLPDDKKTDLHLMYKNPSSILEKAILLKPNLIILQVESEGKFVDLADKIKTNGIKVGISLLEKTSPVIIRPALDLVDHVLIFSGHLGHFGGRANLSLLGKASEIKDIKPNIEIGWDGGINEHNAKTLSVNGIDVLNVGGYIHKAKNPKLAYATLETVVK